MWINLQATTDENKRPLDKDYLCATRYDMSPAAVLSFSDTIPTGALGSMERHVGAMKADQIKTVNKPKIIIYRYDKISRSWIKNLCRQA